MYYQLCCFLVSQAYSQREVYMLLDAAIVAAAQEEKPVHIIFRERFFRKCEPEGYLKINKFVKKVSKLSKK
ncbi:MAG: hypothetical protein ACI89U_002815 [Gammaproteobacteria bacterium]|jgi:hypothetical protein